MSRIDEDAYTSQIGSEVEAAMERTQELPDSSGMTNWTSPIAPGTPHSTGVAQRRSWPVGHFKTRLVKPILPFLTTLYLRAQLIHQLARNVHVFHMQSIYIARQALHLVILLNDAVDANDGPSDEQDDERNDLEDGLIELSKAMTEWGSDKGDVFGYKRQAVEIKQQYAQLFKERFYFHDVRDCSTDPLYRRFVAYDAKTILYRQCRETHINSPTIDINYWTETIEESGREGDTEQRFDSTIESLLSELGQHAVEEPPVSELHTSMAASRPVDEQSASSEGSSELAAPQGVLLPTLEDLMGYYKARKLTRKVFIRGEPEPIATHYTTDLGDLETTQMSSPDSLAVKPGSIMNLNILSLDAGGPQGISQLMILNNIMESISRGFGNDFRGTVKLPCDVFQAIGGVGTGGLIAMLLVVLKMTAAQALEEFTNLVDRVFKEVVPDPKKQTEKLKRAIDDILERHSIGKTMELIPSSQPLPTCKLMVPIMYKNHVGVPCMLRNYITGHGPPTNPTIAEAMLATCATPPIFAPLSMEKDFSSIVYIGGDVGLSNPTHEIIAEAHRAFGDDATVACLLSIGCGHSGIKQSPSGSGIATWIDFLNHVTMNSETTAGEMAARMKNLTLYHRLSVGHGLEALESHSWKDPTVISTHTTNYLSDLEVVECINRCVETIRHGDGFTTLGQLRHSGGTKVLPPAMPPLTPNYVERIESTAVVKNALFNKDGVIKPGSKIIVVTGIGGCGKTQLIRRFLEQYENKFVTAFFIDGSSEGAFQSDLVRHVRSLGTAHCQKTFNESMSFLSQPTPGGQRILIIDNVDNPNVDIAPFLPRWPNGTVIVTSRDGSRGQLGSVHLELDVMSEDESVELLVRGWGKALPPSDSDAEAAIAVAKELGCHPIVLVQAISYMSKTGHSAETYINRLRAFREPVLNEPATNQVDMRYKTAFGAFDASYEILSQREQDALHLLSFFHWQNFTLDLVGMAAENGISSDNFNLIPRGEEFEAATRRLTTIFSASGQWTALELDSLVASLRSHSLVSVVSTGKATLLQMHPLVHEWARLRLPRDVSESFRSAAVRLLCCGATKNNHSMMQYLLPHVQALHSTWGGLHVNDVLSFAFILQESGHYSEAAELRENAYKTLEARLGVDDLKTVGVSASLAYSYRQLGRYGEAETLEKEVLSRRKELLGAEHPDTIEASANLAATYIKRGWYREAEKLQNEVLRRRKELLGQDHPTTIRAAEGLACIYRKQGRYTEAAELERDVLQQRADVLGKNHPDTLRGMYNLAQTYEALKRRPEAIELASDATKKLSETLGETHPLSLKSSAFLATLAEDRPPRPKHKDRALGYLRRVFS